MEKRHGKGLGEIVIENLPGRVSGSPFPSLEGSPEGTKNRKWEGGLLLARHCSSASVLGLRAIVLHTFIASLHPIWVLCWVSWYVGEARVFVLTWLNSPTLSPNFSQTNVFLKISHTQVILWSPDKGLECYSVYYPIIFNKIFIWNNCQCAYSLTLLCSK